MMNASSEAESDKYYIRRKIYKELLEGEYYEICTVEEESYNNYVEYFSHTFYLHIKSGKFYIKQYIYQIDYNPSQGGKPKDDKINSQQITETQAISIIENSPRLKNGELVYEINDILQK